MEQQKVSLKQKFASKKFWTMLLGWITSMATAFGASDNTILQITAVIGGFGLMAVYLLAEASVDKVRANNEGSGQEMDEVHIKYKGDDGNTEADT